MYTKIPILFGSTISVYRVQIYILKKYDGFQKFFLIISTPKKRQVKVYILIYL